MSPSIFSATLKTGAKVIPATLDLTGPDGRQTTKRKYYLIWTIYTRKTDHCEHWPWSKEVRTFPNELTLASFHIDNQNV